MTDSPTAVARACYEAVNARDLDRLAALYAPNVTFNDQPSSPDALRRYCEAYLAAFPDLLLTVTQLVGDGEWVAARIVASGTQTGGFAGAPATGRRAAVAQHDLVRVRDGRIVECWTLLDRLGLLQQAGVWRPGG